MQSKGLEVHQTTSVVMICMAKSRHRLVALCNIKGSLSADVESLGVGTQSEAAYLHTDGLFARGVCRSGLPSRQRSDRKVDPTD